MKNPLIIKNFLIFILISQLLQTCSNGQQINQNSNHSKQVILKLHTYDSLTIPDFFQTFCQNHLETYLSVNNSEYNEFCSVNTLNALDSNNKSHFFTLKILHDLFTSQNASNGSVGDITKIPYFWHWTDPNPRYSILFTHNNTLLKKTKPYPKFEKYQSFADIDRTPYLFLSDWLAPEFRYYTEETDSFSTFGWCSEREMAFVCLTTLLHFKGKVVTSGNHSWSEFTVPMKLTNKETQLFRVNIDNTFNSILWSKTNKNESDRWFLDLGNSQLPKWYNQKALSAEEAMLIKTHKASKKAMAKMERQIIAYLHTLM